MGLFIMVALTPSANAAGYYNMVTFWRGCTTSSPRISYVQLQQKSGTSGSSITLSNFTSAQAAGDLIVVWLNWNGTATASGISDTAGNTYVAAGAYQQGAGSSIGDRRGQLWYAKNINAASAGTNVVTCSLTAATSSVIFCVAVQYHGADKTSPFDTYVTASGTSSIPDSGPANTRFDGEMLVGAGICSGTCGSPGTGWTSRTTINSNLMQDRYVCPTGAYHATSSTSQDFYQLLAAFR